MGLKEELERLRPNLAAAAQRIVDEWEQDEEGLDPDLGSGGVCDRISDALGDVIFGEVDGVNVTEGGWEGDDHAWIIVYDDSDAFAVDIPPGVYETGGGYSWKKIEGAQIGPEDVVIEKVDRDLVVGW